MKDILLPIQLKDMDEVIALARRSYPENIRERVVSSIEFQKSSMELGITDGTKQFKVTSNKQEDGKIVGVCGFYKRGDMNPADVIWGDWFFVDPTKRASPIAFRMGTELIVKAKKMGYRMMCIDTTNNDPDYFNIEPYLEGFGFHSDARIKNYFAPGIDDIFFTLNLRTWEPHFQRRLF